MVTQSASPSAAALERAEHPGRTATQEERAPRRRGGLRAPVPGIAIARDDWLAAPFLAYARLFARYHRHRVVHIERLGELMRRGRRIVLVGNHVLDVLDPLMLTGEMLRRYGRVPHFIGHENLIFGMPGLAQLARAYGMIPSRRMEETEAALAADGLLMLYPGSGSEAARRVYREEPYRLKWDGRLGFLRLALRFDAELLFVAAIGIDEMYYQSSLVTPDWLLRLSGSERYSGSRFQFGLLGPHVVPGMVPLPVRVTHVVSPPLDLGDRAAAKRNPHVLRALHARVWSECQDFLDREVAHRARHSDFVDRGVRGAERLLQRLGL
ncbi:MAG TPA: 1-acyl-sn-glycerol-3-phosphate acyltransferase [Candidatus Binatia bacterium]|nr:1-acyl-sn-glycerol-3-phosphate acyltransferase [Candidatus Binatia bacterium]